MDVFTHVKLVEFIEELEDIWEQFDRLAIQLRNPKALRHIGNHVDAINTQLMSRMDGLAEFVKEQDALSQEETPDE